VAEWEVVAQHAHLILRGTLLPYALPRPAVSLRDGTGYLYPARIIQGGKGGCSVSSKLRSQEWRLYQHHSSVWQIIVLESRGGWPWINTSEHRAR